MIHSSPTLLRFELEGRVFGEGVLEILPSDLYNIRLPLVENNLDFDALVEEFEVKFRTSESVEEIVKWGDN